MTDRQPITSKEDFDRMATERHSLGHWKCIDPKGNETWQRYDGAICEPFTLADEWPIGLRLFDLKQPAPGVPQLSPEHHVEVLAVQHRGLVARVRGLEAREELRIIQSEKVLRGWARRLNLWSEEPTATGPLNKARMQSLGAEIHRAADQLSGEREQIMAETWADGRAREEAAS